MGGYYEERGEGCGRGEWGGRGGEEVDVEGGEGIGFVNVGIWWWWFDEGVFDWWEEVRGGGSEKKSGEEGKVKRI